jgi:hypothetical protein
MNSHTTAEVRHPDEQSLGHAVGSKVEARYRRTDILDERRKLMDAWARYCSTPTSDKVIDLLPDMPSFMRRVCSGYAPWWGVLQTPSV